jgi:hypothetical protein
VTVVLDKYLSHHIDNLGAKEVHLVRDEAKYLYLE